MFKSADILTNANQNAIEAVMDLLYQKEQNIPGSIGYSIKRYFAHLPVATEDTGMMVYHYHTNQPQKNYLELRYCITGNRYCEEKAVLSAVSYQQITAGGKCILLMFSPFTSLIHF